MVFFRVPGHVWVADNTHDASVYLSPMGTFLSTFCSMREIHLRNVRIAQLAIFTLSRCISLFRVVASMYVGIRGGNFVDFSDPE